MKDKMLRLGPQEAPVWGSHQFGYRYSKEAPGFSAQIFIDLINNRIKVVRYQVEDFEDFCRYLQFVAGENDLTKILLTAGEKDWKGFFLRGYLLEALNPSYFAGQPAYHLSRFLSGERRNSSRWDEEERVLAAARQSSTQTEPLSEDYAIRMADESDISGLSSLFASVFSTYPVPVSDPDYLVKAMKNGSIFKIAVHEDKIISAASLEPQGTGTLSVELTDCATLPEHRGQGLMSHLVKELENDAARQGLITVFTIARAASAGISAVFAKQQYQYGGRFVNNCDICGSFEDMNLWSKRL